MTKILDTSIMDGSYLSNADKDFDFSHGDIVDAAVLIIRVSMIQIKSNGDMRFRARKSTGLIGSYRTMAIGALMPNSGSGDAAKPEVDTDGTQNNGISNMVKLFDNPSKANPNTFMNTRIEIPKPGISLPSGGRKAAYFNVTGFDDNDGRMFCESGSFFINENSPITGFRVESSAGFSSGYITAHVE